MAVAFLGKYQQAFLVVFHDDMMGVRMGVLGGDSSSLIGALAPLGSPEMRVRLLLPLAVRRRICWTISHYPKDDCLKLSPCPHLAKKIYELISPTSTPHTSSSGHPFSPHP